MKNKKQYICLGLIFLLGLVLRFYKLGKVPAGFVNDEASFGYNAFSLIKTGKDEFGQSWPLFFRSFGDGKLPVYIYLTIPSILFFGLNEFSVRFPSAFFGSLNIVLVYLLSREFLRFNNEAEEEKITPLLAALVFAFLPWHIHFSRAAFEANLGLFWISLGTWLFLFLIRREKERYLFISFMGLALSLLSYHAPRVFLPLWSGFLILLVWSRLKQKRRSLGLWAFLVIVPGVLILRSPFGLARAKALSIFHEQSGVMISINQKIIETRNQPVWLVRALHNKLESYGRDFLERYFSHFDLNLLFFKGDPLRPRYRVPDVGQVLLIELPFFFLGLYLLVKRRFYLPAVWLLMAPIPSALSFETPSSIRALLMVVPLSFVIGLGIAKTVNYCQKKKLAILNIILIFIFLYNLAYYLDAYYVHAEAHQPYYWQFGYKELVKRINELEPLYNKIEITDARGTPYIYFLFYNQYDPLKYQKEAWENWEAAKSFSYEAIRGLGEKLFFVNQLCPAQKGTEPGVLYVCTEEDHPQKEIERGEVVIVDRIKYQDNQDAFVLMKKGDEKTN